MSLAFLYDVDFRIVKLNPAGAGPVYATVLRNGRTLVSAAQNATQAQILTVLTNDIAVPNGFTIEILNVRSATTPGTENEVLA
jgi:hypothetical protein